MFFMQLKPIATSSVVPPSNEEFRLHHLVASKKGRSRFSLVMTEDRLGIRFSHDFAVIS